MRRSALFVAAAATAALAVAGCTQTVTGHGTARNTTPSTSAPTTTDSASSSPTSSPATPSQVSCPTVRDTAAHLTYPCIVATMTQLADSSHIWQTMVALKVEPQWLMNEGSTALPNAGGVTLPRITAAALEAMQTNSFWGPNATATAKGASDVTISGKQAHIQQTLMTVSPAYRKQKSLKVKTEMLWVVAVRISPTEASAFFCSVPDDVEKYWSAIPKLLTRITVTG